MKETSKFIGDSISLDANTSGTIKIRTERNCKIINIGVFSTGRCKITKFEQVETAIYLSGTVEVDSLRTSGRIYSLTQPWEWSKGIDIIIGLTDISGTKNVVSVMVETIPLS